MKTTLQCFPCFINQVLHISSLSEEGSQKQEEILRNILHVLSTVDYDQTPPHIAQIIHTRIRKLLNNNDPYKEIKKRFNSFALQLVPSLEKKIKNSKDPFETAVRIAIAGNVIDFGINSSITEQEVEQTIEQFLYKEIACNHIKKLKHDVESSSNILYLGDNAGEIVFDRLFIDILPSEKITYAVKGSPVINDVTMEDAVVAGITDRVQVIDNGANLPGTDINQSSQQFKDAFHKADLIIAKGQGNFETLNETTDKNIYFLFKVKCGTVAGLSNCSLGDIVVKHVTGN